MLAIRVLCAVFMRIWHSLVMNELNLKCDVRSIHRLGEYTEQAPAGGTLPLAYFPQQVIVSTSGMNQQSLCAFIWSIADLLREDYQQSAGIDAELKLTTDRILEIIKGLTA